MERPGYKAPPVDDVSHIGQLHYIERKLESRAGAGAGQGVRPGQQARQILYNMTLSYSDIE